MNPFDEGPPGENFVGRERELEVIEDALSPSRSTAGGLIVAGLHGTGKSSLLEECATRCSSRELLPVICPMSAATGHQQLRSMLLAAVNELDQHSRDGSLLLDQWPGLAPDDKLKEPRFQFQSADYLDSAALRHDMGLIAERLNLAGFRGIVFLLDEAQTLDPQALAELRLVARRLAAFLFILAVRVAATPDGPVEAGRAWLRQTIGRGADPGTERFFARVIGVGAFGETEALECIQRRLEGDSISFEAELVTAICALGDRVPREIIQLSRNVYDHCRERRSPHGLLAMLEPAFKTEYKSTIAEATERLSGLGTVQKRALSHLVLAGGAGATVQNIASHLFRTPDRSEQFDEKVAALTTGAALEQLVAACGAVAEAADGKYVIESAINRAAIKVALEMSLI